MDCIGWGNGLVLNKQQSNTCTNYDQVSWTRTVSHTTISQIQFKINHDDVNTLRLKQNGRHFTDGVFKCIFLNKKFCIPIHISLNFVPNKVQFNNIQLLVQIMAWGQPGDKPLSEPMMFSILTHICIIRPQWVYSTNSSRVGYAWLYFELKTHILYLAVTGNSWGTHTQYSGGQLAMLRQGTTISTHSPLGDAAVILIFSNSYQW